MQFFLVHYNPRYTLTLVKVAYFYHIYSTPLYSVNSNSSGSYLYVDKQNYKL